MRTKNRRKHFLVDKNLQFHYLLYIVIMLAVVSGTGIVGSYFGIWASVIKTFSEESLRETMVTAAQINEYEQARRPAPKQLSMPSICSHKMPPSQVLVRTLSWFSIVFVSNYFIFMMCPNLLKSTFKAFPFGT